MRISSVGQYPLQIPISKVVNGVVQDLTSAVATIAVMPADKPPQLTDFHTASVIHDTSTGLFYAEITVGVSPLVLTPGRWGTYVLFDGAIVEGGLIEVF